VIVHLFGYVARDDIEKTLAQRPGSGNIADDGMEHRYRADAAVGVGQQKTARYRLLQ
jgi:hypothetical protein